MSDNARRNDWAKDEQSVNQRGNEFQPDLGNAIPAEPSISPIKSELPTYSRNLNVTQ